MKAILLAAVVALSGSFAVAGADHDGAWQRQVEADLYKTPGMKAQPCVDGTKKTFQYSDGYTDRLLNEVRTCVNGRYFPKTNPRVIKCKEGAIAQWGVSDGYTDRMRTTTFICSGGKYVPAGH